MANNLESTEHMNVGDLLYYDYDRVFEIIKIEGLTHVDIKELTRVNTIYNKIHISIFRKWKAGKVNNWKARIQSNAYPFLKEELKPKHL